MHERVGAFLLELRGERIVIDARLRELREHLLGVAAVAGSIAADRPVIGEGVQRLLGHRVDRMGAASASM